MRRTRQTFTVGLVVVGFFVCPLGLVTARAQTDAGPVTDRSLSEALRSLQDEGLPLVFTTQVVTPDMTVEQEPRSTTTRDRLRELLEPHGLRTMDGPGGLVQIVPARPRRRPTSPRADRPALGTIEGRVLDAANGQPLGDVDVQVVGTGRTARTGTSGDFVLRDLPAGVRSLRVVKDGYVEQIHTIAVPAGSTVDVTVDLPGQIPPLEEQVTVLPDRITPESLVRGPGRVVRRRELRELRPVIADDPVRAIHALPGVAATDDFKTEFSVRGSPYRHVGVVIDGVPTPWLRHTAYGRGEMGSLSMFGGDVLETTTLDVGAYPRRHDGRLGAQVDLTLREGARDATRGRVTLGGANAAVLGEGPLGRDGRGSWLVSARQSHFDWPVRPRGEQSGTVFEFVDALARLAYDVSPDQQVTFSVLGGRSLIDEGDNRPAHALGSGTNRAAIFNLGWRSTLGPDTVLTQRAFVVDHRYLNRTHAGPAAGHGRHRQVGYRADVLRTLGGGLLEAGVQAQRLDTTLTSSRGTSPAPPGAPPAWGGTVGGSSWLRSVYVNASWMPAPRLKLSPGVRVADSTLSGRRAVSPWVLGEYALATDWTLKAGAGVSHQFPELDITAGIPGLERLHPESATHVDVGVEHQLTPTARWQVTLFAREERDVLRQNPTGREHIGRLIEPHWPGLLENALSGSARGVELLVESRGAGPLSGWVAYSLGRARYVDPVRGESFWGDLDQRHSVTLAGHLRINDRTAVAVHLRGGSNFPVPGYFAAGDGGLQLSATRNDTRLPPYVRLDVRATRGFTYFGRTITFFAEVLNVLNRTNLGSADGVILTNTGRAVGYTSALLPRLPSVGVTVEF